MARIGEDLFTWQGASAAGPCISNGMYGSVLASPRTCARLISVAAFDLDAASSFCSSASCPHKLSEIFWCSALRRAVNSRLARSASLFAAATAAWKERSSGMRECGRRMGPVGCARRTLLRSVLSRTFGNLADRAAVFRAREFFRTTTWPQMRTSKHLGRALTTAEVHLHGSTDIFFQVVAEMSISYCISKDTVYLCLS